MITEILFFVVSFGLLFFLYSKQCAKVNENLWKSKGVPYLSKEWSYWDILTRKRGILENNYYQQLKAKGQKFGCVTELGKTGIFLADPDLLKCIFVKDFEHFVDRRDMLDFDPFASKILSVLKGHEWKEVRAFLTPTFTSGKIRRMFEQFNKSGKRLIEVITNEQKYGQGHNVIISDISRRFTVEVIGATVFGIETNVLKDPNSEFYKCAVQLSEPPLTQMLKIGIMAFLPKLASLLNLQAFEVKLVNFFKQILKQALDARASSTGKWDDFLQLMLEAQKGELGLSEMEYQSVNRKMSSLNLNSDRKTSKFQMSEEMIMAQSFAFFFAGFETVSTVVSLSLYALAANPTIQEKVFANVEDGIESSVGEISYDGINRMDYLDMFVSEVMRLYQTLPRLERKCMSDYKIPGTDVVIPKGMIVMINQEAFHKDSEYYPDPEKFRPERFSAEEKAKRSPYVYMPFGIGPRNCIGMRFALIKAKVALAHMVHQFKIEPTGSTPVPMKLEKFFGGVVTRVPPNLELCFVPRRISSFTLHRV